MQGRYQNKYRILSTRYPLHNYDGGVYFATICTAEMKHFFGEISVGEMKYTEIGLYVVEQIEKTIQLRENEVEIPVFAVMPNHIHLIVFIDEPNRRDAPSASQNQIITEKTNAFDASLQDTGSNKFGPQKNNLASVIRGIKSAVKSYANKNNIHFAWQSRYHDRIIRDHHELNRIAEYIENNPFNWATDEYNTIPS